jgi:hypothetical protein
MVASSLSRTPQLWRPQGVSGTSFAATSALLLTAQQVLSSFSILVDHSYTMPIHL